MHRAVFVEADLALQLQGGLDARRADGGHFNAVVFHLHLAHPDARFDLLVAEPVRLARVLGGDRYREGVRLADHAAAFEVIGLLGEREHLRRTTETLHTHRDLALRRVGGLSVLVGVQTELRFDARLENRQFEPVTTDDKQSAATRAFGRRGRPFLMVLFIGVRIMAVFVAAGSGLLAAKDDHPEHQGDEQHCADWQQSLQGRFGKGFFGVHGLLLGRGRRARRGRGSAAARAWALT